jgi:hypothetical protein
MSDDEHDLRFAPIWRATAEIVFSRTLPTADWGARVVSENHRRGTYRAQAAARQAPVAGQ